MRLKHIKLAGFKSFVDPTKIPFEQQMTAIVGPNGCGKSNIIDAVRWVLGESSAKNLRGESMTDVIFNGAASRKPIGQASVELVFDNSEGRLQGNMVNRNEISIRRIVNRESTNSYFLNGSKCRRRDITDIFLGTGLGPRSYAIIEQGTISRLIESKPQELRVFIEEAAGISKYKERRRETETRIKHTRENLTRLNDIRIELESQLARLFHQAESAKHYKKLKIQERKYKAELAVMRWQQFKDASEKHQSTVLQLQQSIDQHSQQKKALEISLFQAKQSLIDHGEEVNTRQQDKLLLTKNIVEAEQNIKYAVLQKNKIEKDNQFIQQKLINEQQLLIDSQKKLTKINIVVTDKEAELCIFEQQLADAQDLFQKLTEQQQQAQQQWQQKSQDYSHSVEQQVYLKSEISSQQTVINTCREKKIESETLLVQSQASESITELAAVNFLESKKIKITIDYNKLIDSKKTLQASLKQTEQKITALHQSYAKNLGSKQVLADNLLLLEQKSQQSEWQLTQSRWLSEQGIDLAGNFYQKLSIDNFWLKAIENVLGTWLQAQCVNEFPGDLSPECLLLIKPQDKQKKISQGTLAEKVDGDHVFSGYLNKIFLADNLAMAKDKLKVIENDESVICPDGTWLSQHFIRKGNIESADTPLQRIEQLSALHEKIEQLDKSLIIENNLIAQLTLTDNNYRESLLTIEKNINEQKILAEKNEQDLALARQQQKYRLTEEKALKNDIEKQEQQLIKAEQALNAFQVLFSKLVVIEPAEQEFFKEKQKTYHDQIQAGNKKIQQFNLQRQQCAVSIEKTNNERIQCLQLISTTEESIKQLNQQQLSNQSLLETNTSPLVNDENSLQLWLEKMSVLDDKLAETQKVIAEIQDTLNEYEQLNNELQAKINVKKEQLAQLHLDVESNRLRAESALEALQQYHQTVEDVVTHMPENAKENIWQAHIIKFGKDINRLGAINLAAIEEYETQLQRKNYLDKQNEDLIIAVSTLESAIEKIDKESRQKFKVTFEQINHDLKILFPKVFGGGHAYLDLIGDDLLDTGVTIMARPPGKKNSTIHLLSGGEKALTALSLVFAIFRLNPAPFCMLDEVDAPLDDANVSRFCNLVQEMSQTVQFIYISHNKVAMEMATHLTGVTMFEPGVSKMVAVDIDEAIAMAEVS